MKETSVFRPVRRGGLILHGILALLAAGGVGVLVWLSFQQNQEIFLILSLLGALVLLAGLLFLVYRGYALYQASYTIEREGLRIRWGLRREDIPLTEMEWVRRPDELLTPLKMPAFAMPGAYLGKTQQADLGEVEFIASNAGSLVIVETVNQVLVLSPENPELFMSTFQRTLEMGSISPIAAQTAQPAQFIRNVFENRYARIAMITGFVLTLLLAVITSLLIPTRTTVSMGINAVGKVLEPVSSKSLLILPLLAALSFVMNVVGGLYFFHEDEDATAAFFLWTAGMVVPVLLLIALLIMVF